MSHSETAHHVVARGQAHALFPPGIGKTVVIEYRADGCVTWKELDSDRDPR